MTDETLFSKIIRKEIKADIIFENDKCLAFKDINPQAPVHILIIPKKPIPKLADASESDINLLGELMFQAKEIAKDLCLQDSGYRIVINNGEGAGQTVFHLHLHLLGGRLMLWPPG